MGERIGRLRKEEASLFLKGKGMEAKNMKLGEELRQKQHELIEQEGFVNKQKQDLIKGSIDFRTIGTHATSNPTLLAGLIASRAVVPQYLQPQQPQTSTELTTYAPRDLPKNIPPPQFRADTEHSKRDKN